MTLASGSSDKTIIIWNTHTGNKIATLQQIIGNTINSVAFSPDGAILASGSWNTAVNIWDTKTWKLIKTLFGHTNRVFSVAFSPDGAILASGSLDETVIIWNINTLEQIITKHTKAVNSVAFSPDGSKLALGLWNNDKVIIWDLYDENVLRELFQPYNTTLLLFLYVLYQRKEQGVDITQLEKEFKDEFIAKYPGQPVPSLLEFKQIYVNLPSNSRDWIQRCFNVIESM
jgi:WD40 repeat protein